MSTEICTVGSIGERIRTERERLGFTQEAFAALAGAAKRSQIGWEQNRTRPDADVLAAWASRGADVLYVLTGGRAREIDMNLLGMAEAALKQAYAELRPGEPIPAAVNLNALTKVYNSVVPKLAADIDVARTVREQAATYIAVVDDPENKMLLTRALFRAPSPANAKATTTTTIIAGNSRVAGRDMISSKTKRRK